MERVPRCTHLPLQTLRLCPAQGSAVRVQDAEQGVEGEAGQGQGEGVERAGTARMPLAVKSGTGVHARQRTPSLQPKTILPARERAACVAVAHEPPLLIFAAQASGNPLKIQEAADMCVLYDSLQARLVSHGPEFVLGGGAKWGGRDFVCVFSLCWHPKPGVGPSLVPSSPRHGASLRVSDSRRAHAAPVSRGGDGCRHTAAAASSTQPTRRPCSWPTSAS